jgi:hypothetical protein
VKSGAFGRFDVVEVSPGAVEDVGSADALVVGVSALATVSGVELEVVAEPPGVAHAATATTNAASKTFFMSRRH